MKYLTFKPAFSLEKYVRYFWLLEGEGTSDRPYIHRSMADGCPEMIFHYNGVFDELTDDNIKQSSFQSGFAGQSKIFKRFRTTQRFGIFGAYLYPYAISDLFSHAASDLTDQMVELDAIIGPKGSELTERIATSNDAQGKVTILSEYLMDRVRRTRPQAPGIFETIRNVVNADGSTRVETLASQSFLSTRQFERKFAQHSGFSPKLFSRIIRFQKTLSSYGSGFKTLTDVAFDCGYYDQSHFIQEFKQFSGHHPKAYFSGLTESTEWRG